MQAVRRGGALLTGVLLMLVVAPSVRADTGAATVAESAPINDLLERARRGIERGDWKFVVDSLQRVIEEPQGALTTRDGRVYESARMQAYRQLADLPQPAMDAYHLLHDGEAGRLYEEAVESYDFTELQRVVDRYLLTQSGGLAAVTLAGWFIDLGKPGPAIAILTDLWNLRRDTGNSATKAAAMMAVAYAQLHKQSAAEEQIEALRLGGALGEAWGNRLDHMAAYVSGNQPRLAADQQSVAADGWPVPFGSNARTGRMPAATPILLDGLPWHRDLPPYASPAPWSAVVQRQLETSRLLASHMLVSGNDLYFKTGGRIFSMDLLSIELNWSTSRSPTRTTRRGASRVQRFNPWSTPQPNTPAAEEARRVEAALSDGVAAAISIAHGLVFELVPEPWDPSNPFRINIPRTFPFGSMQPRENTLVARELHARDQMWALGAGAGASRPPHEMIFTSTPLAVGDALLVTYRDGQDFYAGLLDPFDGGIELKRVYLCTMAPGFLDVPDLLPPAADDQFAYIPTNAGLLLAVNLGDLSLRWASRYERRAVAIPQRPRRRSVPQKPTGSQDRWLAGPPVVAGTVVLLAPADSDYLFAFDRATGHILWKKNRGGHNYILAVDGPAVWLGGRYLTKVDLATGKSDWQIETPFATGRAVLSGRRVLVPTRDGLLMVSADSGQDAETQPLPPNHAPLGRLLCWDGALYSLDTEQIRKFPDLEQSYEPARARHAADPTDASAAIRLAWMELLRQQPDRALETLERVVTNDTLQSRRQSTHIAHLRVEALLAGATSSTLSSADAEARLQQALATSESAEDRFNATSALADQLVRNRKPDEAYQYVWRTAALDVMSGLEQQTIGCKRSMRETLIEKLAEISASLPDAQRGRIAEHLFAETELNEVPGRQNRRRLEQSWAWLAEGDDLAHWNQRAALQLGRLYRDRRKYEMAEYYYRKASDLNLDPQLTASAASGIAEMYVEQGSEARFAWVADGAVVALPTQPVSEGRLLQIETDQAAEPTDLFYVFAPPNNLFAHRLSDGRRVWPTQLRLPTESSLDTQTVLATRTQERPPQAKTDGQILITNTETGLHAVGLITGRRLWSIPIEVPAPPQQHIADSSLFDVHDGKVAVRISAHQLDVVRVVDGHDRLWSARLQDHIIGSVRIAGERVVVFDHAGTAATVFDFQSGQRLFEVSMADGTAGCSLQLYATLLCGVQNGILAGYDLKTGEKRWDRPVRFAVVRHFEAAADCGVLGGIAGEVFAFRPRDGEMLYRGQGASVAAGHAEDGTLFLLGHSQATADSEVHLTAMDLENQSVKWVNPDLGFPICNKRFFEFLPDHFPVLYSRAQTGRSSRPEFLEHEKAYVVLIDKRTGTRSGEPLLVPLVISGQDLIGDLLIRPGRIVIGTNGGVHILLWP